MAYGLRIKDAGGNEKLSITDEITRFRYSTIVAADASGSQDLPDIAGLLSVEFSISLLEEFRGTQHSVSRSGTLISWVPISGGEFHSVQSLIFIFLYS